MAEPEKSRARQGRVSSFLLDPAEDRLRVPLLIQSSKKAFLPDSGILLPDTVTSFDLHFRYVTSVPACEAVNNFRAIARFMITVLKHTSVIIETSLFL